MKSLRENLGIIFIFTAVGCAFLLMFASSVNACNALEQERMQRIEFERRFRVKCEAVGWVVFKIDHGKAEDQWLCLPPQPLN